MSAVDKIRLTRHHIPHETDQNTVADDEPRPVPRNIHIRRNNAPTIPTHNLHRNARTALQTAPDIAAVPRHAQRYLGVYADGGEYGACVLYAGFLGCDEHGEACDADELEGHHEYAALAEFVGVVAGGDGEDAGADVGGDGH